MRAKGSAASMAARLTDENGLVRENAAWAIGEAGVTEKIPLLKASLSDPNAHVKIAAAEALGKMGDASGLPVIEAAIASNDTDARIKAAWALGSISGSTAQSLATKTLDDGLLRVRLGAAVSLLKSDR
jgi:HEAT repeat protein